MIFFSCLNLTANILHSQGAYLSSVQHVSVCQSHWDDSYAHLHTHTDRGSEDTRPQKNHLYQHTHTHTHDYLKQVFWTRPKHVAFPKSNQQQVSVGVSVCVTVDVCDYLCVPLPSLTANPIRGYLIPSEPARWWECGTQSHGHLRQIGFITSL